jgi:hypothetical protein
MLMYSHARYDVRHEVRHSGNGVAVIRNPGKTILPFGFRVASLSEAHGMTGEIHTRRYGPGMTVIVLCQVSV